MANSRSYLARTSQEATFPSPQVAGVSESACACPRPVLDEFEVKMNKIGQTAVITKRELLSKIRRVKF